MACMYLTIFARVSNGHMEAQVNCLKLQKSEFIYCEDKPNDKQD